MEETKQADIQKTEVAAFRAFLIDREISRNTIDSYCYTVGRFLNEYSELTDTNVRLFKAELIESGKRPSTVNLRLCAINAYCKMLGINVHVKKMKQQTSHSVENVITKQEYDQLLDGLRADKKWQWFWNLRLLASTGARVNEYIRLTKADYDRGYAELWTKGKIRRIYIPKTFREESASFYSELQPGDALARGRNPTITSRGVAQMLKLIGKRYGVREEVMHPHSFRHMFAIEFLKHNSNLTLLSDIMGHSSVSTTAIYTRQTREQQIDEVNNTIKW